ncbi:MAG: hypothetical protein FWG99_03765 [Treponema sp.]|nr:hypothetical protein [Treponema sp.]
MEVDKKTAEIFSSSCFWDLEKTKLNLDNSKNYIINRVLCRGNMSDIKLLFNYYGWDTIKEEVVKIKYLNDKILNWLSSLFQIDTKNFRCYNNRGIF